MANPFDWRAAVLAKYAQHVAIIHFPIALSTVEATFDGTAAWTKKEIFHDGGAVQFEDGGDCRVLTGILAWQCPLEGQR